MLKWLLLVVFIVPILMFDYNSVSDKLLNTSTVINSFSDRQVDEEQRIIQDSHTASRHISQAPLMLSKDEASSCEDLMQLVMEEIADFAA